MDSVILYAVDGVLVLLFLLTILNCARIGFARAIAGIVAWIAAAVIALHFCAPLAEAVYTRFLHDRVLEMTVSQVTEKADAVEAVVVTNSVLDELPDLVVRAAEGVGVDIGELQRNTQTTLSDTAQEAAVTLEQRVLAPVITAALKAALFFAIALLVASLVQLIMTPIGKVLHKLPVIGTTDRALGAVLGILKGAVLIAVLAILLRVLQGIFEGNFARAVDNSRIVSFVAQSPFADGFFK